MASITTTAAEIATNSRFDMRATIQHRPPVIACKERIQEKLTKNDRMDTPKTVKNKKTRRGGMEESPDLRSPSLTCSTNPIHGNTNSTAKTNDKESAILYLLLIVR